MTVRVVVADDQVLVRTGLTMILDAQPGIEVVGEAADGHQAVLEARRLQPDVILLDLSMPVRTGLQALEELRAVAAHARIVIFSGFSEALGGVAVELGADLYLRKGADPDAINDSIEQAARGLAGAGRRGALRPSP